MVIGHRYKIIRLLRKEPFGDVILARDQVLDAEIGLKLLLNESPGFENALEHFRMEAVLGLKLHHTQILGLHHLDETAEGVFLIQEPFSGTTLLDLLGRDDRLSTPDALYFIEVLGKGLAFAHNQGIIHQNFNPQNVLVSATEGVKIANFAFPWDDEAPDTLKELKAYIPPEVLRGQKPTPASNLFSLAVLSYRMLVGSLPFPLTLDETFPYDISRATAQMEEIPPALRPLLSQCLDIKPANRFKSITEFLIWLNRSRESWSTEIDHVSLGSVPASPIVPECSRVKGSEPGGNGGEPVIQISPDWMEAEKPRRKLSADQLKGWFEQGKERLGKFLGPQPLKHNLKKQILGGVGVAGLGLILVMGVSSLFSEESKDLDVAKKGEKVEKVETTDSGVPRVGIMTPSSAERPAAISAPPERLPMLAAAPGGPPEGGRAPGSAQGLPPVSEIAPSGAARTETSTGEVQPSKTTAPRQLSTPAKAAPKPASTTKSKTETTKKKVTAKDKKKEQYALLVSSYGKSEEANKMVAKLRQQGKQAVVRKSSQNKKTPYQVWISAIPSRDQAEAAAKSIKTTYGVNSKVVKSGN